MPSAQTRPRSGREEGCDFSVLRGRGGSPEKPERVQTSGSAPALPLGTWGLKISRVMKSTSQTWNNFNSHVVYCPLFLHIGC